MLQTFFKWGLCLLSVLSSPIVQALEPPTPQIALQAHGPGHLRLHYGKEVYTTYQDEVLQLSLPYNSSIQVEAITTSEIQTIEMNHQSIPLTLNQTTWSQNLVLQENLCIEATFKNQVKPESTLAPLPISASSSLRSSLTSLSFPLSQDSFNMGKEETTSENPIENEDEEPLETLISKEPDLENDDHLDQQDILEPSLKQDELEAEGKDDLLLGTDSFEEKPSLDFSENLDQPIESLDQDANQDEPIDSILQAPLEKEDEKPKEEEEIPLEEGQYFGYSSSDLKILVKRLPFMRVDELFDFFHTSLEQIQSDCQLGYEANWIYFRTALAYCLGVLDQIDQEAYLPENLFNETFLLRTPEAILLQKSAMQPSSTPKRQARAAARSTINESVSVVSSMLYQNISIFGNYISNYIWILSNNQHAFCASYLNAPPKRNAVASSIDLVDDAALRKALYYGFAGPGNALGDWSTEQQIIITNDLVSLAFSNTCISQGELNGKMWRTGLKAIWDRIQSLPDPQNYKAYVANFPGTGLNHLNQTTTFQPLAFGRYEEPTPETPPQDTPPIALKPALQLLKTTRDDILSNTGQQNYSLVGAKYEIRKGSSYASGQKITTLTIGKDLSSEVLEVDSAGTYWAKETQAPKGFALDPTAYPIEVTENSTAQSPVRILVYDSPQYCSVNLLAKKIDGSTNQPLANAIFELRYYAIDPSTPSAYQNATPIASWKLKSDANGEVKADLAHIYQADYDFPRPVDNPSLAVFPIGVVTLQEIQAPSGYAINDKVYAIGLKPTATNTTQTNFQVYKAPTIENRKAKIRLAKTSANATGLPGAEFSVQDPKGHIQVIALDSSGKGEVTFDQNGTWTIWESKAPQGYHINTTKAVFTVTGSSITANCPSENAYVTYANHTLTIQDLGDCYGLKIYKTDPSGVPLSQAVFDLYTIDTINALDQKKLVAQATTDFQGIATFGNLEPSKLYVLCESKAPDGYLLPQYEDGVKPEYVINAQPNTSSTSTLQTESGYALIVRPYNLTYSGEKGKPNYLIRESKTNGFSWIKENDLVTITFESVNTPLEKDELPHTGSQSALFCLTLGTFSVWYGLSTTRKLKKKSLH